MKKRFAITELIRARYGDAYFLVCHVRDTILERYGLYEVFSVISFTFYIKYTQVAFAIQ